MKIFYTDKLGIGDKIATALALSRFYPRAHITYETDLPNLQGILSYLTPFAHVITEVKPDISFDHVLHIDDCLYECGQFYNGRVAQIAKATGLSPLPWICQPFRAGPENVKPPKPYIVLHTKASWTEKDLTVDEVATIKAVINSSRYNLIHVPGNYQLPETLSLVQNASGVICVDSCVGHLAFWSYVPTCVIFKHINVANFVYSGLVHNPYFHTITGMDIAKVTQFIESL